MLSNLHHRPIERRVIADAEQGSVMAGRGVPSGVIATTLAIYQAARAGEFATVDPTLATLIGRPPTTVRDLLRNSVQSI